MAVNVKIGEIYKYSYVFSSEEVYTWDFDGIYWIDNYQHPPNSLILILEILNVKDMAFPILKVLIDGKVRYTEYSPEVILEKI